MFFLLAMLMAFAVPLWAQTTVVLGDTNSTLTSNSVPVYWNFKNSYSQSVYSANELSPGTITSISYYYTGSGYNNGTLKFYMKEVPQSTLSGFLPGDGFVEVCTAPVNLTQGWVTFQLTTPFTYIGSGNLVIGVIRDGTEYNYSHYFKCTDVSNVSVYDMDDYDEYSVTNPPSSVSTNSQRPVVKLEMTALEGFCYPVTALTASNITTDEATISWEAMDESSTTFGLAVRRRRMDS